MWLPAPQRRPLFLSLQMTADMPLAEALERHQNFEVYEGRSGLDVRGNQVPTDGKRRDASEGYLAVSPAAFWHLPQIGAAARVQQQLAQHMTALVTQITGHPPEVQCVRLASQTKEKPSSSFPGGTGIRVVIHQ